MGEFVLIKENEIYHLLIQCPFANRYDYDSSYHKSNWNIKILKTEFGKVVVAVEGNLYALQTVASNLDLFSKKDTHIDFNFLHKTYYPQIVDLMKKVAFSKGFSNWRMLVIAEDKAYQIFSDGYIKQDDTLISSLSLAGINEGMLPLYDSHDKNYLINVINTHVKIYSSNLLPALYVNTKDYRIKFIGREK